MTAQVVDVVLIQLADFSRHIRQALIHIRAQAVNSLEYNNRKSKSTKKSSRLPYR